nr:unnamed protein product [Brassica rapa]
MLYSPLPPPLVSSPPPEKTSKDWSTAILTAAVAIPRPQNSLETAYSRLARQLPSPESGLMETQPIGRPSSSKEMERRHGCDIVI